MNNLETQATLDTRHETKKNKRRRKKCDIDLYVSEITISIYDIIINTSHSIMSRILYNVEKIIFLEMHDYYARMNIYLLFLIIYSLKKM